MKRKRTFGKFNYTRARRPMAQTGQVAPANNSLLDALSPMEQMQALLRAQDLGLIQSNTITNDPAVIAQQNAAIEQMLQQEALQNPTSTSGLPGTTNNPGQVVQPPTPNNVVPNPPVTQPAITPPPSMATPNINASGPGSGMGGVNAERAFQQELLADTRTTPVTIPGGGNGLGNALGNVDVTQVAQAAQQFFPDPKSDPNVPKNTLDSQDPNADLNKAALDYNQFLEEMKQVDGTTDPMKSMVDSFAGGSNANKAKNFGTAANKAGMTGLGSAASKVAAPLAFFQAFGSFMEGGTNDQNPRTYTFGEGVSDFMQLKFGEMFRQSKQRKEYTKLYDEALAKKMQAGRENSRMQEQRAVGQNFTGRTYAYNTGPQTRFNYKSGGIKKLRGGVEIDLGRPDMEAVLLKGANHSQGGIDHKDVEAENNEVYTDMEINNPTTGKTEEAGYYFSEFLKDKDGKSFAKKALAAIQSNKDTKSLKQELSNIAAANEEAAKNTGEMGRDKKYIAKYGRIGKKIAQTGTIDWEAAGFDQQTAANLGAPGIENLQPGMGGGFYGDAELNSFRERFANEQLPEYLRESAANLVPKDKSSVYQFQKDYNRYLGDLYAESPNLQDAMTRGEFTSTSPGFNPVVGPGPSTLDSMFGEYTATRPIFTKQMLQPISSLPPEAIDNSVQGEPGESETQPVVDELVEEPEVPAKPALDLPDIPEKNLTGLAGLGQLIPPAYGLANPYAKVAGTDITSGVGLPRLPRVNLEGDRTKALDVAATQFEAMKQAGIGPGSSGVSANIATATGDAIAKISGLENQSNKQLAAAETSARLQASMFNTRSLTNQRQFNKKLEQIENQYGREEKLELLDTLFERIQGIQNTRDQKEAMDNYIDVLDEYDTLDRKQEVKSQQKARDKAERKGQKTPPYWNDQEGRYITDLEIRAAAAKKFPSFQKGGIDYKHGGYYLGKLGALKNKK